MADAPFVSLYRRFRPGRFDETPRPGPRRPGPAQRGARRTRLPRLSLQRPPRHRQDVVRPDPGQGAQLRSAASTASRAASARRASRSPRATRSTSTSSTPPPTTASTPCATSWPTPGSARPGGGRSTSSTRSTCSRPAAANALLKTLEEPPSHVVFVLATTDPQKVPPDHPEPHPASRVPAARRGDPARPARRRSTTQAGLNLDDEAVEAAVRRGRGSARDALSALDQVVASGSADAARPELAGLVDALADSDVGSGPRRAQRPHGRRVGAAATGHRADRRPPPGLPRRARARTVCRLGPVAASAFVDAGRDHGPGPRGAEHGDPRPRA